MTNLPAFLSAFRWLVWDTFRLAASNGLLAVMLFVTATCALFCLSIGFHGDVALEDPREPVEFIPADVASDPGFVERRTGVVSVSGSMSIGFGAFEVGMTRDRGHAVRYVQMLLAGWVADTAGILLILVWTAGFLPAFLEPGSAAVLLAKPIPRWALLVGKFLGVVAFVAVTATLFVGLTWLALAVRSGVWDVSYLWCIPLLVVHFAAFFGFSVFLAVCTRNTIACAIGSVLFWFMCCGLNYGRHEFLLTPELEHGEIARFLLDASYWVMPKPIDMGLILFEAVEAGKVLPTRVFDTAALQEQGILLPELSVLTSLLFAGAMLLVSALQFRKTDY